jgi:hypothetical protein
MDFNSDSHYLGKLCLRGHDYNKTGKSIRYKMSRGCAICVIAKAKAKYGEPHKYNPNWKKKTEDLTAYNRAYRKKHREHLDAIIKAWAKKNGRRKTRIAKIYFNKSGYRERHKKEMMYKRLFLADEYVSSILFQLTGIWIKEPKMIQAKREQLTLTREIRKAKEIANGDDSHRDK